MCLWIFAESALAVTLAAILAVAPEPIKMILIAIFWLHRPLGASLWSKLQLCVAEAGVWAEME